MAAGPWFTVRTNDSGWQASRSYTDTGLEVETQYSYTVRARDTSNNRNRTAPSTEESATTLADDGPPTPNPATEKSISAPSIVHFDENRIAIFSSPWSLPLSSS